MSNRLRGIESPHARLTDEQVRMIYTSTLSQCELAERYSVSSSTVHRIVHGKSWIHITRDLEPPAVRKRGWRGKLTEVQVLEIYHASGTCLDLAVEYGISEPLVSMIRNGRRKARITGHPQPTKADNRQKLNDSAVLAIYNSAAPVAELAAEYGVHIATIRHIKNGHTRRKVTGHPKPSVYRV